MKNFLEIRFPEEISVGTKMGPEYFTDIVTSSNGFEQRNVNWQTARMRFEIAEAINTHQKLMKLISFFHLSKGRAFGFRFKDHSDYSASNEVIALSDGEVKDFQLCKSYKFGEYLTTRIITKPVENTVKIKNHTNYEVDYTKGIIHFYNPPKAGTKITASFEFDVPVRFDTDILSTSIEDYGCYGNATIPLLEVRNI